nr:helix-turn-helix domain-containing protein [Leifsonia xyli]
MEDWAEIRRLYSADGLPIKEIVRRLSISRNTVRAALRCVLIGRADKN